MKENKVFFHGLNSLRAIGALTVFVGHIEVLRKDFGFRNHMDIPFYTNTSGHLGVILFFVLSGFLITYLLLEEKKRFSNISLGKFYIRRILRIWPIYYLMLLLAFFVFPSLFPDYPGRNDLHFWPKLLLCIFFLPNLSLVMFGGMPGASHLWSIGVEEQFYFMWPAIIEKVKSKLLFVLLFIFVSVSLMPHFIDWSFAHYFSSQQWIKAHEVARDFFVGFKINLMALGAVCALLCHQKKESILRLIYHPVVEIIVFVGTFALWFSGFHLRIFNDEFYSALFALIIVNVATNPNPIMGLKYKFLDFFGRISYGFYVYHWLIILACFTFIKKYITTDFENSFGFDVLAYSFPFVITTVVSYTSFHYLEQRILQYKNKFTRVVSGSAD